MPKVLAYIFITIVLLHLNAEDVFASATLNQSSNNEYDHRITTLEGYLKSHNSPLSNEASNFVFYADKFNLDYRLVPAITGVESTFGKRIPKGSFNAYGWANGEYKFNSWGDSIEHVSKTLRQKYYDKGATSISKIAKRYAPPSKTWGKNVKFFMKKIDTLPLSYDI